MNRRARRATIGAAALGAALVAILVVVYRDCIRDHVGAWHFQLTRKTEMIQPPLEGGLHGESTDGPLLIRIAAEELHCPIIFDPADMPQIEKVRADLLHGEGRMLGLLEKSGWRVLEQRFPRRAYICMRSHPPGDERLNTDGLLWDGVDIPEGGTVETIRLPE
jgi:hypothetical protein